MTKQGLSCTHVILSCSLSIVSALLKAQWHILRNYITSCCCDVTMVTVNHLRCSISKKVRRDLQEAANTSVQQTSLVQVLRTTRHLEVINVIIWGKIPKSLQTIHLGSWELITLHFTIMSSNLWLQRNRLIGSRTNIKRECFIFQLLRSVTCQ